MDITDGCLWLFATNVKRHLMIFSLNVASEKTTKCFTIVLCVTNIVIIVTTIGKNVFVDAVL